MILNKKNMRNKKVILILCLLVLVGGSVQAQRLKAVQNEKGRYGFMTEDGTVVIKYKYDEATPFKDGIAKIGKDGKYSLINEDGEIITKRKYKDEAGLKKQRIEAARAIGVAFGNGQQPVTTNITWLH